MARLFDDASTEYLTVNQDKVTGAPFSMAAWCYIDDVTVDSTIIAITDVSSNNPYFDLSCKGTTAGDPFRFRVNTLAAQGNAVTSTGITVDTWHHICGVELATDSRAVYIDGGGKGTDTTSVTPTGIDTVSIGIRHRPSTSQPTSGRVAEVAIWDVALSDSEVLVLAAGFSPLLVHPQSLKLYIPLHRDEDFDWISGLSFTAVNTPSIADHVPIIYPSRPYLFPAAVVGALTTEYVAPVWQQANSGGMVGSIYVGPRRKDRFKLDGCNAAPS